MNNFETFQPAIGMIMAVLISFALTGILGLLTYVRISSNIHNRHSGVILKNRAKIFALMESIISARDFSLKWIRMGDEAIERELDIKFCPTHLI